MLDPTSTGKGKGGGNKIRIKGEGDAAERAIRYVCVCSIRTLNHHARIRVIHRTDREREKERKDVRLN